MQERHKLAVEELQFALAMDDGALLDGVTLDGHRYPHFTLEMETGTGKTYVYLRSLYGNATVNLIQYDGS